MTQTPIEPKIDDTVRTAAPDNSGTEKGSRLKHAFQWAAALTAPFGWKEPVRAFVGQAWDDTKARIGTIVHRKPKL